MRRRGLGLGLVALGAVLLGAALAIRLLLAPDLVRLPLDQTASATAAGSDVTYLDFSTLEEVDGVDATVRLEVQGDAGSEDASDDVAVWSSGTTVTAEDGTLITASSYTACLDRREARSVDCGSEAIDEEPADVDGLTVTFPFGVEQRDYDVWNVTTAQTFPARFEGEEEIEGLEVYRFVQEIPETVIRQTEVPGELAGVPDEESVEADVVYSNTRTLWVEPVSGVLVTSSEAPVTVLRAPDGSTGATILRAEFAASDETVSAGVERAEDNKGKVTLISRTLPLAVAALGLLLVIAGAVIALRARAGAHRAPQAGPPAQEPVSSAK